MPGHKSLPVASTTIWPHLAASQRGLNYIVKQNIKHSETDKYSIISFP